MAKLSKTIDMMLGNHLDAHVMGRRFSPEFFITGFISVTRLGGYEFLMQNCTWNLLN